MSREKLWNNVILPPRQDDSPELFIKSDPYIIYNDHNELDNGLMAIILLLENWGNICHGL